MDLDALKPGDILRQHNLDVDPRASDHYRWAVADHSPVFRTFRMVAPMQLATLALGSALGAIALPPGTVHAGQELEFHEAITSGGRLGCVIKVAQNSVRGGNRFLTLDVLLLNGERLVMTGKTSLIIPPLAEEAR